nr:hypothetical protein SYMBAF_10167 [Serratia symbiotica]
MSVFTKRLTDCSTGKQQLITQLIILLQLIADIHHKHKDRSFR